MLVNCSPYRNDNQVIIMSENPQSFVSPDKLSRPEKDDVAFSAAARLLVLGNAAAAASRYMSASLTNIVAKEALNSYQVEPVQQAQPAPAQAPQTYAEYQAPQPQAYASMPAYQVANPTASASAEGASYGDFSPNANDAYLDAIAADTPQQSASQLTLGDEAQAMADEARRLAADAHDDQTNYPLAA
jgi:hypothetical protein